MSRAFRIALSALGLVVLGTAGWVGGSGYVNAVASEARADGFEQGSATGLNRGRTYCRVGVESGLYYVPHFRTLETPL